MQNCTQFLIKGPLIRNRMHFCMLNCTETNDLQFLFAPAVFINSRMTRKTQECRELNGESGRGRSSRDNVNGTERVIAPNAAVQLQ